MKSLNAKIFYKDKNLFYVSCNDNYARDLKIVPNGIAGKTDCDFYPKELAEKYRADEQRIIVTGQVEEKEEKYMNDGHEVHVHSIRLPVKNEKGDIVGVMGVFFDLTGNNQVEGEHYETFTQSEQLFSSLMSILIYIDENNKVKHWNNVAECTFGIAAEDIIGQSFSGCGVKWSNNEIDKIISDCRGKDKPTRVDDVSYEAPNGKKGFLGITLISNIKYYGTHSGVILLGRDITDRKLMENHLAQAQKLESIGQLAAGIAHEINTPIQYIGDNTRFLKDSFHDLCNLIGVYSKLLKACKAGVSKDDLIREAEEAEKDADVEYLVGEIPKAIQQSLEGIDSVAKIVRAMKEFSHPGAEEKVQIDINNAIESTITVTRNQWKYVADVVTHFDTSLPLVKCMPGEINQVVLNIIVNAAHAIADVVGKSGEAKGIIDVSTRRDGNWVMICIRDTGPGIPEAARAKIFDPFFTTKEVGKGTGQGLAISHDIVVKKHGGTLTFDTEIGHGTTFVIRLPINE